jgi:hypothetical protein
MGFKVGRRENPFTGGGVIDPTFDLHVISFHPEGGHHVVKQKRFSHQQFTVVGLQESLAQKKPRKRGAA